MIDKETFGNQTALFHTFGCKLNFAETSTVARIFASRGIQRVHEGDRPDFIVVNSCSVTEIADKKCRQAIRSFARRYPGAKIVVTGCYAQLKPGEVASLPGVAVVAGTDRKLELADYLDRVTGASSAEEAATFVTPTKEIRSFSPSCSRGDRTRYFLKVQDGCDYWCSYCTIPMARGRSRSGSIEEIVAQARDVAAEGGKEIVITGVNIGDFGRGSGETFFDLCKALDEVEGIDRYRISSSEPNLLTDDLIDFVSRSKRFMPHFHIPLQSGSDTVLKLMHRHYDTALFADKIAKIKQAMPDAFIGVDVMVGCRGETPECFEETYCFLKSLDVTQLHVFPYSERPGTSALSIPYIVDDKTKKLRSKRLLELSEEKTRSFYSRYIGREVEVLFEKAPRGKAMHGFTDNYVRVELSPADARPEYDNMLMRVRLGDFNHDKTALKVDGIWTK